MAGGTRSCLSCRRRGIAKGGRSSVRGAAGLLLDSRWADGPRRSRQAFSLHVPRPALRSGLLLYLREKAARPRRGSARWGRAPVASCRSWWVPGVRQWAAVDPVVVPVARLNQAPFEVSITDLAR